MKNAFFSLLLTAAVASFFSFTNGKARLITEQASDEEEEDDGETYTTADSLALPDTVPHKKDSGKHRPKTVPYDSFGKPKTMDSAK